MYCLGVVVLSDRVLVNVLYNIVILPANSAQDESKDKIPDDKHHQHHAGEEAAERGAAVGMDHNVTV